MGNNNSNTERKFDHCAECGMLVKTGEYHPYAACVLYKQLGQADKVTSCLNSVIEYARSRASVAAPQGDAESKAKEIVEEYKQRVIQLPRVMQLPSGDAVPCAKWLEMRLRIALDLASPAAPSPTGHSEAAPQGDAHGPLRAAVEIAETYRAAQDGWRNVPTRHEIQDIISKHAALPVDDGCSIVLHQTNDGHLHWLCPNCKRENILRVGTIDLNKFLPSVICCECGFEFGVDKKRSTPSLIPEQEPRAREIFDSGFARFPATTSPTATSAEPTCKCGLPKDDPIHSYTTEWQQMHTFIPKSAPPSTQPSARVAAEEIARRCVRAFDESFSYQASHADVLALINKHATTVISRHFPSVQPVEEPPPPLYTPGENRERAIQTLRGSRSPTPSDSVGEEGK